MSPLATAILLDMFLNSYLAIAATSSLLRRALKVSGALHSVFPSLGAELQPGYSSPLLGYSYLN